MRIFTTLALAISLTVSGCAGKLGDLWQAAAATYTNPVREVDIYRVQNAYAASLELAVEYRRYCWAKPYAVLMADPVAKPTCEKRRSVVRFIQKAKGNARRALTLAEDFVLNNPTLSGTAIIEAAWQAVTAFQKSIPARAN